MQNTPFAAQQQQVNKFLQATFNLGAQMDRDQGTTRVIYDTTGSQVGLTQFDFFSQVTAKNYPATNLDQNKFQPGEGMVIKEISFVDIAGGFFDLANTQAAFAILDFYIGNNRVLKALPLTAFSTIAALNPLNRVPLTAAGEPNGVYGTFIRLRTNLVIPPQIEFRATLRLIEPAGTELQPVNLKMSVRGYGKIFNPGQNY
jgi:hypothetical protein